MPEEPKNPTAGESETPSASIEHAPSSDTAETTDFPSTDKPQPTTKKSGESETPSASIDRAPSSDAPETTDLPSTDKPQAAAKKPAAKAEGDKPPAKAKKEKAPAVEDKPFAEFIQQDYLPALQAALTKQGVKDLEVSLAKQKLPVAGMSSAGDCWQVIGKFQEGERQFNLYFPQENIQSQRAFSCAENNTKTSTLEPFLIDERKVTLDLMVFGVVQRLNAQKWLNLN
jgi:cytoskeletal protein RodZ